MSESPFDTNDDGGATKVTCRLQQTRTPATERLPKAKSPLVVDAYMFTIESPPLLVWLLKVEMRAEDDCGTRALATFASSRIHDACTAGSGIDTTPSHKQDHTA